MDTLKQLFDLDANERRRHQEVVHKYRGDVQQWISSGLPDLQAAAQATGGRLTLNGFANVLGVTDSPVALEGAVQGYEDFEAKRLFNVSVRWNKGDPDTVVVTAGTSENRLTVASALELTLTEVVTSTVGTELKKRRSVT